jgi:hypothetical protein
VCYPAIGPKAYLPPAGTALTFPAFLMCEDMPVRAGSKYVLRLALAGDAR